METTAKRSRRPEVDNDFYHSLGERWYHASDDPVALLRAEARLKNPWISKTIQKYLPATSHPTILDMGCGAGLLSNALARSGLHVTGIDLSEESLLIAQQYDSTRSVRYLATDATQVPLCSESFDAVCAMDFLEHVESPVRVIQEASRLLRPGGLFFFHTFNRTPLAWLFAKQGLEWFVKNTPRNLHVYRLFIKPKELRKLMRYAGLQPGKFVGSRPVFSKAFMNLLFSGVVPEDFQFKFCRSLAVGYSGYAVKPPYSRIIKMRDPSTAPLSGADR